MRHHDHSTGKYYYHNTTTQQTVWEKPADYDGEDSDDGGAVLEMQQNPMRAASLHYGGDESTSSEEEEEFPPIAVVEGVVPKAQWAAPTSDEGDAASAAPTRKHIGGDWYENFDRASGKTYYVNTKTRETRWIWPKEVEKRAAAEKVGAGRVFASGPRSKRAREASGSISSSLPSRVPARPSFWTRRGLAAWVRRRITIRS